jgi:ATP-dependent DNA helicase RecG
MGDAPPEPLTLRELRAIPVARLTGVGPALEERLAIMGIESVLDVLQHYPRRYIDRTHRSDIAALAVGEEATVFGEVLRANGRRTRNGRALVEVVVSDGTSNLSCTFFNQAWREKQLTPGTEVALFGKVDVYRGKRQMTNPVVDVVGRSGESEKTGRVVPIYPQSGKADIATWQMAKLVQDALRRASRRGFADPIPERARVDLELESRDAAYRAIHQPEHMGVLQAARKRLIFDEFLRMQVGLVARKRAVAAQESGIRHTLDGGLVAAFHERLPFALTHDQQAAIAEIERDLASAAPMHRLLQGDVGSGKTVVAALAAAIAIDAGWQCALMAPTEILAEQHFRKLIGWLEPLLAPRGQRVAWLTGSQKKKERGQMLALVASGEAALVIGTHAVIQDQVQFKALGLAIIDEQHRFGVEQRLALRGKLAQVEREPHLLMMSATPIPRTLAMSYYADLDVSTIDELPPGRTPVVTKLISDSRRAEVIERIRHQLAQGRQVYWVCPLIEESETLDLTNATETHQALSQALPGVMVGLLHSRMPQPEKKAVMTLFTGGQMGVLVSTTVIEVGVDVPNASLMVIEHAERFGLSQLHQLRGRVGRGAAASACVLLYAAGENGRLSEAGRARLKAMAETSDGFEIARRDLEIRGPGEFLGARQSGAPLLRFADLVTDTELLEWARRVAPLLLDRHPALARRHVGRWLGGKSEYLKA